jgi:hypothetical protein
LTAFPEAGVYSDKTNSKAEAASKSKAESDFHSVTA